MCGIAGMIGLSCDSMVKHKMLETMRRRGPDAVGVACMGTCTLLHSRLAIIDLECGDQPMHLRRNGEDYTIAYNGELYNTEELRTLLLQLGHQFIGHSDTEVVLHAYTQWQEKCLDRFNGIFAFAVFEHKRNKLFLARDRMGVKPLFYKLHDNGIIFSSEIKTILAYPTVKAEIDHDGIAQVILLGPGRCPGSGVLRGINELEPGCYGYYLAGKWNWKRYWKLLDKAHIDDFEETAKHVEFLVTDTIKQQMVSDVPIGTFLSGGLDSSIISSVCAREMREQGKVLQTFSLDYENNDKYFVPGKFQPNSDNSYIQKMQMYLETDHRWTVLSAEELINALEDATYARDLPGMADVDFSLLLFCKEIRKSVKVALSGECADEIFGGYPWYRDPDVRSVDGFPWSQNIEQRSALLHKHIEKKMDPKEYVHKHYIQTLNWCDISPDNSPLERRMKQMMVLNMRWFMQTLLDRKDRMSMYSGLEVRVPFCDYRIAEYLYNVPWEYKEYGNREKGLLRHAMKSYLPEEVLYRKKSPYPKTFDPQYLVFVEGRLNALLHEKDAPLFELIPREKLIEFVQTDAKWPWYGQLMKRPQTIAYMLQINEWLRHYNIDILL